MRAFKRFLGNKLAGALVATPNDLDAVRTNPAIESALRRVPSPTSQSCGPSTEDFTRMMEIVSSCEFYASKFRLPCRVFNTEARATVFRKLTATAVNLASGEFHGKGDLASTALVGARGIGKSTSLRYFAAVAPLLLPSVIPIYVSWDEPEALAHSVGDTLVAALLEAGVVVKNETSKIDDISDALAAQKKYALFLLDEADKLYECRTGWLCDAPVQTLRELAAIANMPAGRFATILCGSSAMMMDLVTANAKTDPESVKLFPLLSHAIDLNGSKFREYRVCSSFGDVESVGSSVVPNKLGVDEVRKRRSTLP